MTKYNKVEGDISSPSVKEVSKDEVEAEIQEAMEEGRTKIIELEAEIVALKEREVETSVCRMNDLELIDQLNAEVKKLTPNVPKVHEKKMAFINDLRQRDTKGLNKTCASCSRRLPLKKMDNGAANFCDDCLGK